MKLRAVEVELPKVNSMGAEIRKNFSGNISGLSAHESYFDVYGQTKAKRK